MERDLHAGRSGNRWPFTSFCHVVQDQWRGLELRRFSFIVGVTGIDMEIRLAQLRVEVPDGLVNPRKVLPAKNTFEADMAASWGGNVPAFRALQAA